MPNAIYKPRIMLRSFETLDAPSRMACIAWFVEALGQVDAAWLRAHPETPRIYASGVRYVERGLGFCGDDWRDIPEVLRLGQGVCEDLAAWRIAELRVREAVNAEPLVTSSMVPGSRGGDDMIVYHIQVGLPDGSIEDPSVALGMKG